MTAPHKRTAAKSSPRLLAWHCLMRWDKGGVFAEALIRHEGQQLSQPDRAMLQAIVLGVLRHLRLLDYMLRALRQNKRTQEEVRWLLLAGLCQLFVLRWPEYAVVNEMVRIAPQRLRPLVNGVLRQALRRAPEWEAELPHLPLGVRYSMPDWLVERWTARWGETECRELLKSFGESAPVCLRLNTLRPLPDIPADWQPIPGAAGWYELHDSPLPHEALAAGQIYVADPSTRYSIELLAPRPGEKILDACAAPGGKSAAILSATGGECELLATDAEAHRLPMLRENLQRTGARHVQVAQHDWTRPCPRAWQGAFDAVLVDVPCSNSGVFRRRVDARWRLTPAELRKLTAVQKRITENAMQALRPGGRLVYSTCSIEAEEDADMVQKLLRLHPTWRLLQDFLALPHHLHADGAYAALLQKD